MIVMDIKDKSKELELFIERQIIGNRIYRIERAYAPKTGIDPTNVRITITTINESADPKHYSEVHGLEYCDGNIRSFYHFDDKKGSTHDAAYLDDSMEYYDEIISDFNKLLDSGELSFSPKALIIFSDVKKAAEKKRNI